MSSTGWRPFTDWTCKTYVHVILTNHNGRQWAHLFLAIIILVHACTYIYINICIYIFIYVCIYTYIYIYMYLYIHVYIYIFISIYICICIYIYAFMYIYIHIFHIYMHTHIYIYTYTCVCVCVCMCVCIMAIQRIWKPSFKHFRFKPLNQESDVSLLHIWIGVVTSQHVRIFKLLFRSCANQPRINIAVLGV